MANFFNIHAPAGEYGPFSLPGVLSYFRAGYRYWAAENVQTATAIIGTLGVAATTVWAVRTALGWLKPSTLSAYAHVQTGSWALVTGSTDGIGKGFAESLLDSGFNVLLHGRNPEKLAKVKGELVARFPGRQVATVVADAGTSSAAYSDIAAAATDLPNNGKLTILVNNVGGAPFSPSFALLDDTPHEHIDLCININARFPTHLTREILPILRKNGPSLIVNCGSLAGLNPVPSLAVYGATKAYVHAFTEGLQADLHAAALWGAEDAAQVEVIGAWIGNVLSGGNKNEVPLFTLTSRQCADGILSRVGSGYTMVYPSWRVVAMILVVNMLPESYRQRMVAGEMRKQMEEERRKLA